MATKHLSANSGLISVMLAVAASLALAGAKTLESPTHQRPIPSAASWNELAAQTRSPRQIRAANVHSRSACAPAIEPASLAGRAALHLRVAAFESGAPLLGARLELFTASAECGCTQTQPGEELVRSWRSDEQGRASTLELPLGTYVLRASAAGRAQQVLGPFQLLTSRDELSLTLSLAIAERVRGHIVDAAGLPIEGAVLRYQLADGQLLDRGVRVLVAPATSDRFGVFELEGLPRGDGLIHASAARQALLTTSVIAPSEKVLRLQFPPGAGLSGRVLREGRAVTGVRVDAGIGAGGRPARAQTDAYGRFSLQGLNAGPRYVSIETADGLSPRRRLGAEFVELIAGEQLELELELAPLTTGALMGLALRQGIPIQGGRVEARGRGATALVRESTKLGSDGAFHFASLPCGDYELLLLVGEMWIRADARVEAGGRSEVELQLDPCSVRGTLWDGSSAQAHAGVRLGIARMEDDQWQLLRPPHDDGPSTDTNGAFALELAEAGLYRLVFRMRGGFQHSEPFELGPGESRSGLALASSTPTDSYLRSRADGD